MFARNHQDHIFIDMYSPDQEDFAKDANLLDSWVFEKVETFFNTSITRPELQKRLSQDKVVFFLHLLGIDTTGHSKKPYSTEYLNNIISVDKGVERMYKLFENYYPDKATSYIFTSDHGMSDKGNHGDGERANTETPFIAWGAGIRSPQHSYPPPPSNPSDSEWTIPSPKKWKLNHLRRVDLHQADIAPLMSCLVGIPFPMNSVGVLPTSYLQMTKNGIADCVITNAKQIFAQVQMHSRIKKEKTFFFREFAQLTVFDGMKLISELENLFKLGKFDEAVQVSEKFVQLCLEALNYYHTYDRFGLFILMSFSYLGWLLCLGMDLSRVFYHPPVPGMTYSAPGFIGLEDIVVVGFLAIVFVGLYIQSAPLQYYAYFALPAYLWTIVFKNRSLIWKFFISRGTTNFFSDDRHVNGLFKNPLLCLLLIEIQVYAFYARTLFSLCMLVLVLWGFFNKNIYPHLKAFWVVSCMVVGIFPSLPIGPDIPFLVWGGGVLGSIIFLLGTSDELRSSFLEAGECMDSTIRRRILFQIFLLLLSSWLVWSTEDSLSRGEGLPFVNSLLSLVILVYSLMSLWWLPSCCHYFDLFLFFGVTFATPFLLLSVAYEVLFLLSFMAMLISWIQIEINLAVSNKHHHHHDEVLSSKHGTSINQVRIGIFYALFCWISFFGTGNIASVSSFQLSSTYRFLTGFKPFRMGLLLIIKILIPFTFVSTIFGMIHKIHNWSMTTSFYVVLISTDIMALNFFFLVKDYGSWLDIGTSISHFCGTNGFILFHILLFLFSMFILRRGVKSVSDGRRHLE
eukprot:TRINITY_DN312_c0_g1_i5.p1 TRINITY_DN312_c0_g1~~TRINITY_DN312_c0_g1_i5.p1  ORF type:complete len:794 (-),score=147.17 TRINITY_DN312_c0_g1_i5:1424-3805(-)